MINVPRKKPISHTNISPLQLLYLNQNVQPKNQYMHYDLNKTRNNYLCADNIDDQLRIVTYVKHSVREQSHELFWRNKLRWTGKKHGHKIPAVATSDAATDYPVYIYLRSRGAEHSAMELGLPRAISFPIHVGIPGETRPATIEFPALS